MNDQFDWREPNDDDDDDPFLWDEDRWEEALRESDERSEKFGQLIEKYGTDEESMEKIFDEMGWTDLYDTIYDMTFPSDEESDEYLDADDVIQESKLITELESEEDDIAHPIGQYAYELASYVLKIEGRDDISFSEHPLIIMINGFLECCGNLAAAGYMHSWAEDEEDDDLQPQGLTLALLKRASKNLLRSIAMLNRLEHQKILTPLLINHLRTNGRKLMIDLNKEIKLIRNKHDW